MEIPKTLCIDCKFRIQGEISCFCANPNQKDKDLRRYVYWCDKCKLFEEGRHPDLSKNNFCLSEKYNGFKDDSIKYLD